ncbi:Cytochrome P450 [Mycena kentingensis (nom. inval.)]|nr:Cytochrome P450 [Mycena kentingensis (nom. inval.)]
MSAFVATLSAAVAVFVYWAVDQLRRRLLLPGPPSPSFLFGHTKQISTHERPGDLFDLWKHQFGSVYRVSGPLGSTRIVLCDPSAIAHVFARDSWKYSHPPILQLKELIKMTGAGNLLALIGQPHSRYAVTYLTGKRVHDCSCRERKLLNRVFDPASLKRYAGPMCDCAYKVFSAWESQLQDSAHNEMVVDISDWMDHVSFDIIGLTTFSTDFKSLDGKESPVLTALTAIGLAKISPAAEKILLLSQAYPSLLNIPLPRSKLVSDLSDAMEIVIKQLVDAADAVDTPSSALKVLLNAKDLSPRQVGVHAKSILLAGFATTASSIKWALKELSMHPAKQDRLRAELLAACSTQDPTYDDLMGSALPYLEAVVSESLRLHPIIDDASRLALEDDIIPLKNPIHLASGAITDRIHIPKGTTLMTPLYYANVARSIWGPDAAEFKPERWMNDGEGIPASARAYPGYHHTMSFLDGPRTCLGKGFALLEMKRHAQIVLSLLIRKFIFSPRDGEDTKYATVFFLGLHPKLAGEPGGAFPHARAPRRVA